MAPTMATDELLRKLDALVCDEGQPVTYKWVSRHFSISANLAKRCVRQLQDAPFFTQHASAFSPSCIPKARL